MSRKPGPVERWVDANHTWKPGIERSIANDLLGEPTSGVHKVAGAIVHVGPEREWTTRRVRRDVIALISAWRQSEAKRSETAEPQVGRRA